MPWVIKLGGHPDLFTRDTGVFDTLADLLLVAVGKSSVNVTVAGLKSDLDSLTNLTRLRLPCAETNGGNLCAGIEREVLLCPVFGCHSCECTDHVIGD